MDLHDALDRFLLQLEADGRSKHTTLAQYQRHVRLLAAWLAQKGHSCDVRAVDDQDLARFLASPIATTRADGRPKEPGSVNALRASLKGFFGYLRRAGIVDRDPAKMIRRAVCSPPPPRELRPHEEEKLRAVLEAAEGPEAERDRVLFELMLGTGIRLSSALALDVGDLDLEEGVVLLRTMKRGGQQHVFLPDRIRDLLATFLGGRRQGPVFGSKQGVRISGRHAQRRFRAWREKAGVSASVTPHTLRHGFAMRLYDRTSDLLLVRAALGHRSITSTMIYAHVGSDRLRLAVTQSGG